MNEVSPFEFHEKLSTGSKHIHEKFFRPLSKEAL